MRMLYHILIIILLIMMIIILKNIANMIALMKILFVNG